MQRWVSWISLSHEITAGEGADLVRQEGGWQMICFPGKQSYRSCKRSTQHLVCQWKEPGQKRRYRCLCHCIILLFEMGYCMVALVWNEDMAEFWNLFPTNICILKKYIQRAVSEVNLKKLQKLYRIDHDREFTYHNRLEWRSGTEVL